MAAPSGQRIALKASVPQKGYLRDMLVTADDTEDSQTFYFRCTEKLSEDILKLYHC